MQDRIAKLIAAAGIVGVLGVGSMQLASAQDDPTSTTVEESTDNATTDTTVADSSDDGTSDDTAPDREDCPKDDAAATDADPSGS